MYSAALAAGEPESPMGYVFLHGTNEKAGEYAEAAKMLRRALALEEKAAAAERTADFTDRDARILNLRDGLGETLLHAASEQSLAEAQQVLSALAEDVRERVAEHVGASFLVGRLIDINSRLGVLAYLQSAAGPAAAQHLLDAMNGLVTHLAAVKPRATRASPRLLVAVAAYVQLMQELQADEGSEDAACKQRQGNALNNRFPRTVGWEGQEEAAAADAAVREHAEDDGRHRMDPVLGQLSHRVVSCAPFRGERGGIGAGPFRTDQPALIDGPVSPFFL
jgi:hypothetical protein